VHFSAKQAAVWKSVFEFSTVHGDQRLHRIQVPDGVVGRYVRLQSESIGKQLTLAEVQVSVLCVRMCQTRNVALKV